MIASDYRYYGVELRNLQMASAPKRELDQEPTAIVRLNGVGATALDSPRLARSLV